MSDRNPERWRTPIDIVLVATVVFASIPLALTLNLRIATIPIQNAFLFATALVVALAYASQYRGSRRFVALYVAGGLFVGAVTLLYMNGPAFDRRAAIQDVLSYAGLPIGVALSQFKGRDDFHILLRRCYFAVCITFAVSLALLVGGYIESAGGADRQLDPAMYTSSFIITMSFPCLWSRARLNRWLPKIFVLSGLMLSIFFAVISATRSVFITILISLACTAVVEIKRDHRNLLWIGTAASVLAVAASSGIAPGLDAFENTKLAERLGSTDYANEDRYEELNRMLDQMGPSEWIHGSGFGVGFQSPITEEGLATVPHIGLAALLYKGGAPALLILIVGPCLICMFGLLMVRRSSRDPFMAGVTIYFVQSCLSGGWAFIPLLLLGAFLRLGSEKEAAVNREVFVVVTSTVSPSGFETQAITRINRKTPGSVAR